MRGKPLVHLMAISSTEARTARVIMAYLMICGTPTTHEVHLRPGV